MTSSGSEVISTNSEFLPEKRSGPLQFLPKFAVDRFRDGAAPEVGECKILASFDKATNKMKFEYSVTWTDKSATKKKRRTKKSSRKTSKTSKSSKSKSKSKRKKEKSGRKKKQQKQPASCAGSCSCVSMNSCETCDASCRCECLESDFSCCTTNPCCCKSASKECESTAPSKVNSTAVTSSQSEVSSKKKKKASKKITEGVRKCDGPCGKRRSVKNLWVMGNCEHAICALCLSNAPMVEGPGDTLHCCNSECFATDLADRLTDEKKRRKYHKKILRKEDVSALFAGYHPTHRRRRFDVVQDAIDALPSESSVSTHSPPLKSETEANAQSDRAVSAASRLSTSKPFSELVNLSVLVATRGQCRSITYRRLAREISDTKRFYDLLEWIVLTGNLPAPIDEAAVFLSKSSKYRPDELTPIDVENSLGKELWQFNVAKGNFYLAIDYTKEFHKRGSSQKIAQKL